MRMMIVPRRRQAGFSMIETLITLVVISVGLLGLAKIQAASISYTQNTRVRSLIALQTESLAAAMHANKAFWAAGLAPRRSRSAPPPSRMRPARSMPRCRGVRAHARPASLPPTTCRPGPAR